jgi:hypothetical protein
VNTKAGARQLCACQSNATCVLQPGGWSPKGDFLPPFVRVKQRRGHCVVCGAGRSEGWRGCRERKVARGCARRATGWGLAGGGGRPKCIGDVRESGGEGGGTHHGCDEKVPPCVVAVSRPPVERAGASRSAFNGGVQIWSIHADVSRDEDADGSTHSEPATGINS